MSEPMTLVERLRNPQWKTLGLGQAEMDAPAARRDMTLAAARIEALENAINRYLADDFSCNGGAEIMFEEVMADSA